MLTSWLAVGLVALWPGVAIAAPSERGSAPAESTREPFIRRHAPRRNSWHLGIAGGVFLPSRGLDLRSDGVMHQKFERVTADLALRAAYFPLRFLGLELEGTVMPGGRVVGSGEPVTFWGIRGHAILQLPFWRIVPFATLGGGGLGVQSRATAVGDDLDGTMSWGGGVKLHLTRHLGLRFDVRTNLSQKAAGSDLADSEEVLLGLVVRLGPRPDAPPPPAPSDRDADGYLDADDGCPDTAGVAPAGCPIEDRDRDGVVDPEDRCPNEKGDPPTGCPVRDGDGDGVLDDDDACPKEAGLAPRGCPIGDRDSDGILDDEDACPDEPETDNGHEDEDGCPDVAPEVERFTGVIEGIVFELDQAAIRSESRTKLDEVVQVLTQHPELRIEISGHTDSSGPREHNMELSRRRAEAVRDHLVQHGVDAGRIETRGAGPDEPIDSNAHATGRANNRRIEFRVLD
jgi:outer membrane protein OmpA-like peptidoglycan-associated protein